MFLGRKQRAKLKAKGCTEGRYHHLFNHQTDTFLWSWMISWALVDYTNMDHILDNMYTSCVSMSDSIGSITSFPHTSMVVYPGSNDHLQVHN